MQVREFAPADRESRAAVAMAAGADARSPERSNLQHLQGRESLAVKQRRPGQKERVEKVWRERHARQPAEAPDDEWEGHWWFSARRLMFRITRRCTAPKTSCVHKSEEHTSELQSRVDISYAVFCLKKKKK